MGMTIDDSLELFEDNFTVINTHGHYTEEEESQAIETAIETMRKYQKIQKIINNAKDSDGAVKYNWLYEQISGVMEDGTD